MTDPVVRRWSPRAASGTAGEADVGVFGKSGVQNEKLGWKAR